MLVIRFSAKTEIHLIKINICLPLKHTSNALAHSSVGKNSSIIITITIGISEWLIDGGGGGGGGKVVMEYGRKSNNKRSIAMKMCVVYCQLLAALDNIIHLHSASGQNQFTPFNSIAMMSLLVSTDAALPLYKHCINSPANIYFSSQPKHTLFLPSFLHPSFHQDLASTETFIPRN